MFSALAFFLFFQQKHGLKAACSSSDALSTSETVEAESSPVSQEELLLPLQSLALDEIIGTDTVLQEARKIAAESDQGHRQSNSAQNAIRQDSADRQTGEQPTTVQSPRTDSGIESRAATSAEMGEVPGLTTAAAAPEPQLDTMAEITDLSFSSELEEESRDTQVHVRSFPQISSDFETLHLAQKKAQKKSKKLWLSSQLA